MGRPISFILPFRWPFLQLSFYFAASCSQPMPRRQSTVGMSLLSYCLHFHFGRRDCSYSHFVYRMGKVLVTFREFLHCHLLQKPFVVVCTRLLVHCNVLSNSTYEGYTHTVTVFLSVAVHCYLLYHEHYLRCILLVLLVSSTCYSLIKHPL